MLFLLLQLRCTCIGELMNCFRCYCLEVVTSLLEAVCNGLSAGGEATEAGGCGRGNLVMAAEGPIQFLAC